MTGARHLLVATNPYAQMRRFLRACRLLPAGITLFRLNPTHCDLVVAHESILDVAHAFAPLNHS